jgi:hypothetical protein
MKTVAAFFYRKSMVFCLLLLLSAALFIGCGDEDNIQGGSMHSGSVAGVVRDAATKNPIPGVTVIVDDKSYVTAGDGYFIFADIPVGQNTLNAQKDTYAMYSAYITIVENQTINHNVELTKVYITDMIQ